jgi:hypothetical protein
MESSRSEESVAQMGDVAAGVLGFTDPALLDLVEMADVPVPRGEPRRRVAEVADALVARAPEQELREKLTAAAETLWNADTRARLERALTKRAASEPAPSLDTPAAENALAHALAYRSALPLVARDERVQAPLEELEPTFAGFDEEDRDSHGPVLARTAVPALALDVELMKDEGYRFVAVFPPEGSEGVDVVGKAANWLTRRMTVEGDAPRVNMRRFLALLAEEVEVALPVTAETIDRLVAEPMPEGPMRDRMFVALARGLVEEAVAERGFPF